MLLDFSAAEGDRISLSGIAPVSAVVTAFDGHAGQIVLKAIPGGIKVFLDADGDKVANLMIQVVGTTPLTYSDFV